MAGDSETNDDLAAHQASYARFMGWLKFGTIASAIVAAFVVWLIA